MKSLALILALSALTLSACKDEQKPAENPNTAPPVAENASAEPAPASAAPSPVGSYHGILPCADCEGIDTTLVLNADGSYTLTTLFVGEANAQPESVNGKYTQSDDGSLVRLDDAGFGYTYFIGDGVLEMRDSNGSSGDRSAEEIALYRLQKQ